MTSGQSSLGNDPDMHGDKRDAHLKRSLEPLLTFGNDADDMRLRVKQ